MSGGNGAAPLNAAERAELVRLRSQASFRADDSGAAAGLSPLDRVNRIHVMAGGLAALSGIFDSAMNAPAEYEATALAWAPVHGLLAMIARDIGHETGALWDEVRPLVVAAKAAQP